MTARERGESTSCISLLELTEEHHSIAGAIVLAVKRKIDTRHDSDACFHGGEEYHDAVINATSKTKLRICSSFKTKRNGLLYHSMHVLSSNNH